MQKRAILLATVVALCFGTAAQAAPSDPSVSETGNVAAQPETPFETASAGTVASDSDDPSDGVVTTRLHAQGPASADAEEDATAVDVPEPAVLILLGGSLVAIAFLRRRKH